VHLGIYDVLGRRIRTLLDDEVAPGHREVRWDGRGLTGDLVSPGLYFARLTSSSGQRLARVVLIR
jgi:flagellar hook assembly protein FlgD